MCLLVFMILARARARCWSAWQNVSYRSIEDVPSQTLEKMNQVEVLKGNNIYRYGDMVVHKVIPLRTRVREDPAYDGTLLHEWLVAGPNLHSLGLLARLYADKRAIDLPTNDVLVVHVRTGDHVGGRGLGSPQTRQDLRRAMSVHLPHVSSVVVVTALHYGVTEKKHRFAFTNSSLVRNKLFLARFLDRIPCHSVTVRSSLDPDDDFVFMALAPRFAATIRSGGFSKTVLLVRAELGLDRPLTGSIGFPSDL